MDPFNEWWGYAIGGAFIAMGIYGCCAPDEKLFIKIGSKSAPPGARPLPRWVGVLMSLSFVIIGVYVAAYKTIEHRFSHALAIRLLFVAVSFCLSSWGLGNLYVGINAHPDPGVESFPTKTAEYRSNAFISAFACLIAVLFLVYLVIAWPP